MRLMRLNLFYLIAMTSLVVIFFPTHFVFAAQSFVAFTSRPSFPQIVPPGQQNIIFYALTNYANRALPLTVTTSSPFLRVASTGNTCGRVLAANNSCTLPLVLTAPNSSQTLAVTINVDYQGRAPLQDKAIYNIDANQTCRLISSNNYQTEFCQTQYQRAVQFTNSVFNIVNSNVANGQTVGGVLGIYQHSGQTDRICFISCGLRELGGTPPDQFTMFELASVTKTFTASILGTKVHGGFDPYNQVAPHLPKTTWLGEQFNLNANETPVTFQQLATFSGGVCFSDAPSVVLTDSNLQKQSQYVHDMNLLDPSSATCQGGTPNVTSIYGGSAHLPTKNFYSNSSFGLLGQALMSMDGYSQMEDGDFNAWMCRNVLTPLNMTMTNGCLPSDAQNKTCLVTNNICNTSQWSNAEYAQGYHVTNGQFESGSPFTFVPWSAAGNLRSNASDMIQYIIANLGLINSTDPTVLALEAGMQIAHTSNNYLPVPSGQSARPNTGSQQPLAGGQGYGWVCDPLSTDPNAICGKIGGHANFSSFVGFSMSKKYGIVILFNTGDLANDDSSNVSAITTPKIATIGVNLIKAASNS